MCLYGEPWRGTNMVVIDLLWTWCSRLREEKVRESYMYVITRGGESPLLYSIGPRNVRGRLSNEQLVWNSFHTHFWRDDVDDTSGNNCWVQLPTHNRYNNNYTCNIIIVITPHACTNWKWGKVIDWVSWYICFKKRLLQSTYLLCKRRLLEVAAGILEVYIAVSV